MGGPGSGPAGGKRTTESLPALSIHEAKRAGLVPTGAGSVRLPVLGVEIELDWTPCTYGGSRPWWVCPRCGRRCAVLYAAPDGLGCRVCLRLAYPSTREDDLDRYMRKARELRRRLRCPGGLGAPMVRPPRMKRRTFDRLVVELMRTEARAMGALEARLAAMVEGKAREGGGGRP